MLDRGSSIGQRVAAFAGGVATLALLQALHARFAKRSQKVEKSHATVISTKDLAAPKPLPKGLEQELFSRNLMFFGEEAFERLQHSFVVVVGLGGVGSHAAHMLARAGLKKLRIIDFDQVSLSSLNRHAVATLADVGTPKAIALRNHLLAVVPGCDIDARDTMFQAKDAAKLLEGNPSYVLDCIDDVNTKCQLLAYCGERGIKVMSSLGAACKADPTRVHIATLADATRDPLAAKIKWRLKKHAVDPDKILCVYSSEKPVTELMPLSDEQKDTPEEFGVVDHFRVRVLPVLGTMPAIFGQAMAAQVMCELAGKAFQPVLTGQLTRTLKHKLCQRLRAREMKLHDAPPPPVDMDDVEHMITQVWRGRCAVSGMRILGQHTLELVRWRADGGCVPNNLVLLASPEVVRFDAQGQGAFTPEVVAGIEAHLASLGSDWL